MKTISVCNQKGGVGKSTTVYHLASSLSRHGKRVLVIDLDPQGNITTALAAEDTDQDRIAVADALSDRTSDMLADVIIPACFDNVDLAPTFGDGLTVVQNELIVAGAGRESRLAKELQALNGSNRNWDFCLIDCPPSIDQLTINGLVAANQALIVTHAKLWSAQGIAKLLGNINAVKDSYNPRLNVAGIVINQIEANTLGAKDWQREISSYAKQVGVALLYPSIPKRVAIADSLERGQALADKPLRAIFDAHAERLIKEAKNA